MSIFKKIVYISEKYSSLQVMKFRRVATLKTHQRPGFRTVLDITRTPYDGFPRNLCVSYSNFEALLAINVQKLAGMLAFSQIVLKKKIGCLFPKNILPSKGWDSEIGKYKCAYFAFVASERLLDSADASVLSFCFE